MGKRKALCIARLANILETEFLDCFFITDFLSVIFGVIKHLHVRSAIPSSAERREHLFIREFISADAQSPT